MAETPNSFKDPYWSDLAGSVESKLELPKGLLVAVLTRGERSNNDQVSEAGAKTPFQIIPATRTAAIKKYGIDPYLSPENAAEVAGNLLKDSLQRNGGDPKLAVAEYVGGTDRKNWGPTTKAYVQRVTGSLPDAAPAAPASAPPAAGQSTFDRVSAQMATPSAPAIANVFAAYQSGQMSADEAKQFEGDVKAGHIMLPRGATLKGTAPAPNTSELPASVLAAYQSGAMPEADRKQLEADVSGGLVKVPSTFALAPTAAQPAPVPTAGDMNPQIATAEVGGSLLSGLIAAPVAGLAGLGTMAGNALGLTDRDPADVVHGVGDALTYQPRSQSAQSTLGIINKPLEMLARAGDAVGGTVADTTGSPALGAAANAALQVGLPAVLGKVGGGVVGKVREVRAGPDPVAMAADAPPVAPPAAPIARPAAAPAATPGTKGSVGAAGTDVATQRAVAAGDLPVPLELTKGQATRDFEQQRFERETAKDPSVGEPLRQRFAQQNEDMLRNFDAFVDQTGAAATDLRSTGVAVDKALVAKAARDKTEIRIAYKNAEKSGELQAPVPTDGLVQAINDNRSAEKLAPVLGAARDELVRLGGAAVGDDGLLVPRETTLGNLETVRKLINKGTGIDPTNIKFASDLKGAIDQLTEGAGGELYRQARSLRTRYAQQYENRAVINKLLSTKPGTADRSVAYEDVWNHSIAQGSLDDVRTVRKVLQTAGPEGHQAWRELQGQTIAYLKDEATRSAARDVRGNPIVSAHALNRAIAALDKDGKLDFIFGKRGAEKLRTVNDVAKVVYTAPPGSVNASNTASVLMAALDMGMSSSVGLPLPVMSGLRMISSRMKDRTLRRRVEDALGRTQSVH